MRQSRERVWSSSLELEALEQEVMKQIFLVWEEPEVDLSS